MFGLVASPGYIPPPEEMTALRPAFLRSILYRVADCNRIAAVSPQYIVTVNNECAEVRGWTAWDEAISMIANLPRPPFAVCVGNEFDLFWQNNPADVPPSFAADLVKRASSILRPRGIKTVATSVAGGSWPLYLHQMADLCRDEADWFDIHPYGQRPDNWGSPGWMFGDLSRTMRTAYQIAKKPVICSEIGVKIGDADPGGGEDQQGWWLRAAAETLKSLGPEVCPGAAWFAWRDEVGAPYERGLQAFGLRREGGSRRPSWYQFQALPQTPEDPMSRFTVGDGVLAQMAALNDTPATDEIYHPIGAAAGHHQYSETFGASGRRYVYIFSVNKTVVYDPEGL